jgi:hypothetical protein
MTKTHLTTLVAVILAVQAAAIAAVPNPPTPMSPGTSTDTGYTVTSLTPTLQWTGSTGADYYALAISQYPYGQGYIVYNPQQVYGTSISVPTGKLQTGTKYRWNMQAHNSSGWSAVSATTLYFQTPAPATPTITSVSPAQPQATDGYQNFTIYGSNFDGTAYVNLKDNGGTVHPLSGSRIISQDSTHITVNPNFTTLGVGTWYAQVVNGSGTSSTWFSFQVVAAPTAPTRIISLSGNLVFGNVQVGKSSQSTLTINNTGNSTLTVSSISYPNGFSGNWSGGTIAAAGSHLVTVTFSPTSAISYGSTITVNSNKTSGTNTIPASGIGVSVATKPTATTVAATPSTITASGATLNSTVNPNGSSTTIHFQYGLTTSYGSTTTPVSIGTSSGSYPQPISGLSSNTTYHFRVVATNSGGTNYGSDLTFKTTTSVVTKPTATTVAASAKTANGATLNSTVNPNGSSTMVSFQYGTTTSYGSTTTPVSIGTSSSIYSQTISGLSSNTTYHFRVVATNSGGTTYGSDLTFKTTASDTKPDQFTFTPKTGVALNTPVTSNMITVSGINTASPITITTGGTYSINSGAYTSAAGTINNGNTVTVKQTSSGSYSSKTNATLTIGGVSGTFSVTTQSAPPPSGSLPCAGKGDWIVHMNHWSDKNGSHPGCLEIWSLSNVSELVAYEKNRGIQWITVKCGDGNWGVQANGDYDSYYAEQWNSALITSCHKAGIKVFAWAYVYGGAGNEVNRPTNINGEISVATAALAVTDNNGAPPDGLIIDWETEYESLGNAVACANQYCQGIRASYPKSTTFMAHAPNWNIKGHHPDIYKAFNTYCQVVMPQWYSSAYTTTETWLQPYSPHVMLKGNVGNGGTFPGVDQLWADQQAAWTSAGRSDAVIPIVPIIAAAPPAKAPEVTDFVNELKNDSSPATANGYQGVSFYDCDKHTAEIWSTIASATIGSTLKGDLDGIGLSSPPSPSDTTPPTISAFSVTPNSVVLGSPVTISYTVSDTGGSGLNRVVLWRATDVNGDGEPNWPNDPNGYIEIRHLSGKISDSNSFSDTPSSVGTYWYGIDVNDNNDNWNNENNSETNSVPSDFGPNGRVTVTSPLTDVYTPNVEGMTADNADMAIVNANLVVGTVATEYSNTVAAGNIISQNPAAGTTVATGSAVNYVKSLGKQ